jgi:hypothetical protein
MLTNRKLNILTVFSLPRTIGIVRLPAALSPLISPKSLIVEPTNIMIPDIVIV